MYDPIKIVSAIYEAFGKGDIPAILDHLAEAVQWESWPDNSAQKAGVPWMQQRNDKAGVMEFFSVIGGFQIQNFNVLSMMRGDNQVAVEFEIEFIYPPTGVRVQEQEIHLWTFDERGKVIRFRHYLDTAKHIATASGE